MDPTPPYLAAVPVMPGPPRELLSSTSFLLKRLGMLAKERTLDAFQATGLTPYHYAILALLEEGSRETQATIADALGYDRSQLVGLLDELEQKGLITRQRDTGDRRRHLVSLTAGGRRALVALRATVSELEDVFFEPLDGEERAALHGLLSILASHHDPRCHAVARTTVGE
jgi:MarR family transcriptional regulator, lower aerobic nicotinate degradation pathway regulator